MNFLIVDGNTLLLPRLVDSFANRNTAHSCFGTPDFSQLKIIAPETYQCIIIEPFHGPVPNDLEDTCKALVAQGVKIIILTGAEESTAQEFIANGSATHYVSKFLSPDKIYYAIMEAVGQERTAAGEARTTNRVPAR